MILPDVNVLLYAFLAGAEHHAQYAPWLQSTLTTDTLLLPDAVLAGFLRIATNRRIQSNPAPITEAFAFITVLRSNSRAVDHPGAIWHSFGALIGGDRQITGNRVPDAYLAAVAISHNATLATRDRGFARYPGLRWFDPGGASD